MKKILAAITITAMLVITSSAMAKGAKVPKELCLQSESDVNWWRASTKSIGSLVIDGSKVKTYAVTGVGMYDELFSGTCFVIPGTTTLRLEWVAVYEGTGGATSASKIMEIDLVTGVGNESYRYDFTNGNFSIGEDGIFLIDCKIWVSSAPPAAINRANVSVQGEE